MDEVVLKNNKSKKYGVFQFMRMTEDERASLKGKIICELCKADAKFRREGSNGSTACFYATHIGKCDNSSSNDNKNKEGEEETNVVKLDISKFNIIWNYTNEKTQDSSLSNADVDKEEGKNQQKYTKNPSISKKAVISMPQILNFAKSYILKEQEILINHNGSEVNISEIVHRFNEIKDDNLFEDRFFWGEMKYLDNQYISVRDCANTYILIDKVIIDNFNDIYRDKFFKIVKNNEVIVFGTAKKKSGKVFIVLKDLKHIYFRKKR